MPDPEITVRVRAPVRPTEVPERVRDAVLNLFPDADVTVGEHEVTASVADLGNLAKLVAEHRIPDTARSVMLRGLDPVRGTSTRFHLGKQAAFMGKPSFAPPVSPLGEINVEVEARDADALATAIYEAAPDTTVDEEWSRVPFERRPPEARPPPREPKGAADEEE